ncbi:hypothetical protein [Pelagicoccus sp. SDUM812005]|uniref:hypothetical protein n=1 Tax=Pelagicoccus sp. SDUM812005 TaxID=3041257 RepID=UPI00280EF5E8|nr:hypothetical protein [Pelagicoccus sp. SDUM812005]MDQ8183078.1 hypothetical protein [Pelagicoccus sp. SDUM812005]
MFRTRVILLLAFALASGFELVAQSSSGGGYVFSGVEPLKGFKRELCPVVGAEKKRLLIETSSGLRKSRFGQTFVSLRAKLVATEHYAEIRNFDFSFENRAQFRRDGALQSALEADAEYAQAKIDQIDTTDRPVVEGQPRNMSKEEFREALSESSAASRNLQEGLFGRASQLADTIYLSFDIVPEGDYEETFAAVVVVHDQLDAEGNLLGRVAIPSLERSGDLEAGVANSVAIQLRTREQLLSNLELSVFLFTRTGEPIATNLSGAVKELGPEAFEAVESELRARQ